MNHNPYAQLRERLRNLYPSNHRDLPGVEGDALFILTLAERVLPTDDFTPGSDDPAKYCLSRLTQIGNCYAVNLLWQKFK